MTDNSIDINEPEALSPLDSPDYGFDFTPLERLMAQLFGPTPEMLDKMNRKLQEMSDDDLRGYGQRVALGHLADPFNDAYDAEDFIKGAEKNGIVLPELVKTTVRETVDAAPRDTFEQAMEKARNTGNAQDADDDLAEVLDKFNASESQADAEAAYQNGFDTGKLFQHGWNTAQFTGTEVLALIEAEGGQLSEHTKRGLRDAYAHYKPVEVAVPQALATELVAEAL